MRVSTDVDTDVVMRIVVGRCPGRAATPRCRGDAVSRRVRVQGMSQPQRVKAKPERLTPAARAPMSWNRRQSTKAALTFLAVFVGSSLALGGGAIGVALVGVWAAWWATCQRMPPDARPATPSSSKHQPTATLTASSPEPSGDPKNSEEEQMDTITNEEVIALCGPLFPHTCEIQQFALYHGVLRAVHAVPVDKPAMQILLDRVAPGIQVGDVLSLETSPKEILIKVWGQPDRRIIIDK